MKDNFYHQDHRDHHHEDQDLGHDHHNGDKDQGDHLTLIESSAEQTDVGEMNRASVRSGDRSENYLFSTSTSGNSILSPKKWGSKSEVS